MALGTSDISLSRENIVEKLCRLAWRPSFSFLLVGNAMGRRIIALGGGVRWRMMDCAATSALV